MTNMASPSTSSTPTPDNKDRRALVSSMIFQGSLDPSVAGGFVYSGVSTTPDQARDANWLIQGLSVVEFFADSLGETIMAYYMESPQNPLLGIAWTRNNEHNKRLWEVEQTLFNDARGRAVLLVMYLIRDGVVEPSAIVAKQALQMYLRGLSDYSGLSNYERQALARDETILNKLLYLFTDYKHLIRGGPGDSFSPEDIKLAEHNFGHLYCTEESLIIIRNNLVAGDYNLPVFSQRRHMLIVLQVMFERMLCYQVNTIAEDLYRELPDNTAGWYAFYALVFEYYFGLPQARAVDPWWKVGYPGSSRLLQLIEDTIDIEELTIEDFKKSPSSRNVRLVYSMLVGHLNTILPNYAMKWLHETLGSFAGDPSRLLDIMECIALWKKEREHPCSDSRMMRHGVVFNLPPVTKDLAESIRTFSAEVEDPDCRLALHNPFARSRPDFVKQKYFEGQEYRQRRGWTAKQPTLCPTILTPDYDIRMRY